MTQNVLQDTIQQLKSFAGSAVNQVGSFLQKYPSPASYVAQQVAPPVQKLLSSLQTPLSQQYAQSTQNVQKRVSPVVANLVSWAQSSVPTIPQQVADFLRQNPLPAAWANQQFQTRVAQPVVKQVQRVGQQLQRVNIPEIPVPQQVKVGMPVLQLPEQINVFAQSYGRTLAEPQKHPLETALNILPFIGFAKTKPIQQALRDRLVLTKTPEEAAIIYNEFAEKVLKTGAKSDLQALRAAFSKELTTFVGGTGNYKTDYKIIQGLKNDTQVGPIIRTILDKVSKIDDVLSKTPKTTTERLITRLLPSEPKASGRGEALAAERAAKADFDAWRASYRAQTVSPAVHTTANIKTVTGGIRQQTASPMAKEVEELKDIGNVSAGWRDVFRNFEAVFGKRIGDARRVLLDPFDAAKGDYVDYIKSWDQKLRTEVVDKLGITKGKRLSELTQLYGEKKLTPEQLTQIKLSDLDRIREADSWFRQAYDSILIDVNKTRLQIGLPEIPRRVDYYRHFREMQEAFAGVKNVFETPAGIDPALAGISDFTKPKSKFLSFAQRRLGIRTENDAVGGFLDYLPAASYAKNIDPQIGKFRALGQELVAATSDPANPLTYRKLNNFIEFLNDFANDLSGKTNPLDRGFQKYIPGGRMSFKAINWANSRVKANVILGNVSASLAQIFNVPQGMASVKNPRYWVEGVGDILASIFRPNPAMDKSTFLKERFFRMPKYDTGMLAYPKRFALWMVTVLDTYGSKYIWNMHYRKALAEGIPNAVKYADDFTRQMVAGRGIGEVPLAQKARVMQLIAPFQVEVANLWWVMKDFVDEKAFDKLAILFVLNYVFNKAAVAVRGSAVVFDPIQAMIDAFQTYQGEENKGIGAIRVAGRLTGEVLSNLPVGQTAAAMYPQYGVKIPGTDETLTRKEVFGREDPTRFGTGLLVMKGLQDPLYKLLLPFGGAQLEKTIQGLQSYSAGESTTPAGRTRFQIEQTPGNLLRSVLFGGYATPEAQQYFAARGQGTTTPKATKKLAIRSTGRGGVGKKIAVGRVQTPKFTKAKRIKIRMPVIKPLKIGRLKIRTLARVPKMKRLKLRSVESLQKQFAALGKRSALAQAMGSSFKRFA